MLAPGGVGPMLWGIWGRGRLATMWFSATNGELSGWNPFERSEVAETHISAQKRARLPFAGTTLMRAGHWLKRSTGPPKRPTSPGCGNCCSTLVRPRCAGPLRSHETIYVTPLNVLLSHLVLDLTREAERNSPGVNVVAWSDFWRVADGAHSRQVHLDARISRRAMKTYLDGHERAGNLLVDGGVLQLTDLGRGIRNASWSAVERACRSAESRLDPSLRDALAGLVGALELEYAHYIHPYGTADASVTGGGAAGAKYGSDWKPVPRQRDHDTTDGLSLLALLSQALTAFTVEYESYRRGPLLWAVNLTSAFDGPMALAAVPSALLITGDGRSAMERHGYVAVSGGQARLTRAGEAVKRGYEQLVAAVESSWRLRCGVHAVDSLRSALEVSEASLTVTHANHPIVKYVGKGFAETSGSSSSRA
jgi:hypothetical protein